MEVERATENISWAAHLQRYLEANIPGDPELAAERKRLVDHLQANPCSAQAWAQFLMHEEASRPATTGRSAQGNPGLRTLFRCAVELVPLEHGQASEPYTYLWIGHARHIWYRQQDEGRDLFKAIKNRQYPHKGALVYREWALLEFEAGNTNKAVSVLEKGLKDGAEPRSMLEGLLTRWQCAPGEGNAAGGVRGEQAVTAVQERKVHFQAATALDATSLTDGAASFRRAAPSTPGVHLKVHDPSCTTTCSSGNGSSVSKSSTTMLPGDLSLGLLSHQHTGCVPSKSHMSYQSQAYDDDTINCRSGEENRTSGSLGTSSRPGAGNGGSTGTVTMPAGIASTLNLAAGAAAVAALGSSASGGSGMTGNNTGNMSLGLRRFGFKGKAVRVNNDGKAGAAQSEGVSPTLTGVSSPAAMAVGSTVAALGTTPDAGQQSAALAEAAQPVAACGFSGASAAPTCSGFAPSQPVRTTEPQASDDSDEAASRKRRAAAEAALSPARFVASVMLQEEGMKRRQSPDAVQPACEASGSGLPVMRNASAASCAGGSLSARDADRQQHHVPSNAGRCSSIATVASSEKLHLHDSAQSAAAAACFAAAGVGWSGGGLPAPPNVGMRQMLPPSAHLAAPSAAASQRDSAMGSFPSISAGQAVGSSAMERPFGNTAPGHVRSARAPVSTCADENMVPADAPAASTGPVPMVMDENQAPAPHSAKPAKLATPAAASASAAQQQAQLLDSREPLRPVGYAATRPGPSAHAPVVAPPPQQPIQQPVVHVPQPQMQPQQPQPVGNWPERLEQRQLRPIENEMYVYVHGIRYQKLDLAGKGGSSKVYKVLGLNRVIYALKRVRFQNKDSEAVKGFVEEITLLRQLRGKPNIIQLIDSQVFQGDGHNGVGFVYMVLEYGDIDLAKLLYSHEEARRRANAGMSDQGDGDGMDAGGICQEIDANFIRLYWQQMLRAVKCIHDARIVHADLKPANFMLVQGQLKLIDFGIAKAIQGDTTSINRESQVGTLNYMSPEAIQGGSSNPLGGPPLKVGRPSDVWSLGCILYQMIYGRTPFADLAFVPKMSAICNPEYQVPMPDCGEPDAVDCIRRCLDRNPKTRISLQELLDHPFLHPNRRKPQQQEQPQPAPSSAPSGMGSLTEEQIKAILQLGVGGGGDADLDSIARRVMQQLSGGDGGVAAMAASAPSSSSQGQSAPPPPPPPPPPLFHAAAQRAPPPPPPPPPPFLQQAGASRAPPPPPPPPAPGPIPVGPADPTSRPAVQQRPAQPIPFGSAPRSINAPGGMGDIAAMAAAAAAKRAMKPLGDQQEKSKPAQPLRSAALSGGPHPGGNGLLPLAGAELQAAILQQRAQLRPVQEQHAQPPHGGPGTAAGGAGFPSSQQAGGRQTPSAGEAEGGLEAVLRRGLERFHFSDSGGDTHGNTAFIEAAMTAARREG